MKKLFLLLIFGLLSGIAKTSPLVDLPIKDIIFDTKKQIFYSQVFNSPFTPELFRRALFFEEIQSPEIVYQQAQLETGNFKSELFLCANNAFGMRFPRVRDTFASGEYNGYAKYRSWLSCVKDYAQWQRWYIDRGYSLDNYYLFLSEIGYATNKNYIALIKEMS